MTAEGEDFNKECWTRPAVEVAAEEYQEKGSFKSYGGYDKVYFTGPTSTGKAIVIIYDVLGLSPQCIQGADILADQSNALVLIPDVFKGQGLPRDVLGSKGEEVEQRKKEWRATTGNHKNHFEEVYALTDYLRGDGYKSVGLVGFCWGGKLVTLVGRDPVKVVGVAAVHPSKVEPTDAETLAVPIGFYPSRGESKEDCDKFWEGIASKPFASKSEYKYYATMHHGWAGGRADLKDEENLKEFKDVYRRMGIFFESVFN